MARAERESSGSRRAVFLDRDGVINQDDGYVHRIEDLVLLPRVPEALRALKERGFLLIVVTNQSGVARGMFTMTDVERFHAAMNERLASQGAPRIDHFKICPHHPDGVIPELKAACPCRKPEPGLLFDAAKSLGIDLSTSYMVGDRESDIECGRRAGCHVIAIGKTGYASLFAALPAIT